MLPKNKIECIALMKYFEYIGEEAALRDMPVTDLQIHEDDAFVDFMFRRRLPEGEAHVHIMVDPETGSTLIRDLP